MTYTLVDHAERIARLAHGDQTDKSGGPYIGHPQRVAARVQGEVAKAVAWLHDVIEDTHLDAQDLINAGIPGFVVETVKILTHTRYEPNETYWWRIRTNDLARQVKLADIADNTDPERLEALDPATRERLTKKYARALEVLG